MEGDDKGDFFRQHVCVLLMRSCSASACDTVYSIDKNAVTSLRCIAPNGGKIN